MITCENCNFFDKLITEGNLSDPMIDYGDCMNKEVIDQRDNQKNTLILAGSDDDYGSYFHVHKDFGCIKGKRW